MCTFYGCECLESVKISEGLETIGDEAFYRTAIKSIILPASLRTISWGAFRECGHLETVTFGEGSEALGANERFPNEGTRRGVFE